MEKNPESHLSSQEISVVKKMNEFYSAQSESGKELSPKEKQIIDTLLADEQNIDVQFRRETKAILTQTKENRRQLSREVTALLQSNSTDFNNALENGNASYIKSLQKYLSIASDGIIGIGTFTSFKKSPLAKYFSLGSVATGEVTQDTLWKYATDSGDITHKNIYQFIRKIEATLAHVGETQGIERELALGFFQIENSDIDIYALQEQIGLTSGKGLEGKFGPKTFGELVKMTQKHAVSPENIFLYATQLSQGDTSFIEPISSPKTVSSTSPRVSPHPEKKISDTPEAISENPQQIVSSEATETLQQPESDFLDTVRDYVFEKLEISGDIQNISIDEETGEIYMTLGDGTQKTIHLEDDSYTYARFLFQASNDKQETYPSSQKLQSSVSAMSVEDRKKIQEILGITGKRVDGIFGKGTYQAFVQSAISDILSLEDMVNMTQISGDEISDFIPGSKIVNGDFVLIDESTGAMIVVNETTKKFDIFSSQEVQSGLQEYQAYLVFSKDFSSLSSSQQENLLKNISLEGSDFANNAQMFQAIKQHRIFSEFDVGQIADGVKYSGDTDHLVGVFGKFGFNEKFFSDMNISQGEFLTYNSERNLFVITFDGNTLREYDESLVLETCIESGNIEVILAFLERTSDVDATFTILQNHIQNNKQKARSIFTDTGDFPFSLDFHGSRVLESRLTAFDIFGDIEYLKQGEVVYRNTGEGFVREQTLVEKIFSGAFTSQEGNILKISRNTQLQNPSSEEIGMYNEDITFEKLFQIFEQAAGKVEGRQLGEFMKKMIGEKQFFSQTREKFADGTDREGYLVNLDGYNFLTAYELFGDKEFIADDSGKIYKKDDTTGNFFSKTFQRLSIHTGDAILIHIEDTEKFSSITDIITSQDISAFSQYFSSLSETEVQEVLQSIRDMGEENPELYQNMRNMFAPGDIQDGFTVNIQENTFLTAKDIFGDMQYMSFGEKSGLKNIFQKGKDGNFYSLIDGERLLISGGERIFFQSQEDIDFSKYILKGDKDVRKIGKPRFLRNPKTRVTLCARSALKFASNIGYGCTPWAGYAFEQFHNMKGPKVGNVPTLKNPNSLNLGLGEMIAFLKTNRVKAAQIYLDAAGKYHEGKPPKQVYYGHVATIVLDKSGEYFVFDAYNGGGEPIPLAQYYTDRKGEISRGHGKKKKFKGIAKLG